MPNETVYSTPSQNTQYLVSMRIFFFIIQLQQNTATKPLIYKLQTDNSFVSWMFVYGMHVAVFVCERVCVKLEIFDKSNFKRAKQKCYWLKCFYDVDLLPFPIMRLKFENYTVASLLNNDQIRLDERRKKTIHRENQNDDEKKK